MAPTMRDRETGVVRDVSERWLERWPDDYESIAPAAHDDGLDGLSADGLRAALARAGVRHPAKARKRELLELLRAAVSQTPAPSAEDSAPADPIHTAGGTTEGATE